MNRARMGLLCKLLNVVSKGVSSELMLRRECSRALDLRGTFNERTGVY